MDIAKTGLRTQLLGIVLPSEYILRYPAAGCGATQQLGRTMPCEWVANE